MEPQKIGLPAETSSPSLGEQTASLRLEFRSVAHEITYAGYIDHLIV